MIDHRLYYDLNQFQAAPRTSRWWPKVIALLGILGGVYGAAIGSAISTTAGAADVIVIAAGIMAVIVGVPGARIGSLLGLVTRTRFGRFFLGMLAAMGGAILGGFFGIVAVMPVGAILGAVVGWLLTGAILRHGFFRRLLGQVVGLVLGACVGAIVVALQRDQGAALVGIGWGLGVGIVVGPLPLLLFMKMLDSLASTQRAQRTVIDAKVVDASHDED
ncbi:MAG: hypothetical protein ABR915_21175 [Thermoguttaceae bacterium]|jgi:hypothetical protein